MLHISSFRCYVRVCFGATFSLSSFFSKLKLLAKQKPLFRLIRKMVRQKGTKTTTKYRKEKCIIKGNKKANTNASHTSHRRTFWSNECITCTMTTYFLLWLLLVFFFYYYYCYPYCTACDAMVGYVQNVSVNVTVRV